jgi:ArsR family transcriptional regulator
VVSCRRDGKAIFYAIADEKARRMVGLLYDMFCEPARC